MQTKAGEIIDRREMLQVKLKTLAQEARIIKRLEKSRRYIKGVRGIRDELHAHRIHVVRPEARATHLALGFIRGRTLDQMENKRKTEPDWKKVRSMLAKFGPTGYELSPDLIYRQIEAKAA